MIDKTAFIGFDTVYPLANGESQARIHLDGAASPLVMKTAMDAIEEILPHYSNSHSFSHASARVCAEAFKQASASILRITGANEDYQCIFMGSGSTNCINNIARRLKSRKDKNGNLLNLALVSAMEHHANDLPHRQYSTVEHFGLIDNGTTADLGDIDLAGLESKLKQHEGEINYVTFSAVSNVTGIVNPIKEMTELAHQYGAYAVVDCAQMAAHMPLNIAELDADFVIFSGHKVYAGMAPGVMIAKQAILAAHPSDEMGGGIVEQVSYLDETFTSVYPNREHPGTKNILGIHALSSVLSKMNDIGFRNIQEHSETLWKYAFQALQQLRDSNGKPLISIYAKSKSPRLGALSFNVINIDHGLVAAILSDYFGIAVRNECFCAHPYVSALLKQELWEIDLDNIPEEHQETVINRKRGMIRVSFSLYNSESDINKLCEALQRIANNVEDYQQLYNALNNGDYIHKSFSIQTEDYL